MAIASGETTTRLRESRMHDSRVDARVTHADRRNHRFFRRSSLASSLHSDLRATDGFAVHTGPAAPSIGEVP